MLPAGMVFELVYDKRVCKACGQKHIEEETHHGNQPIVLLTTTGKILPAVMLVVIVVFIIMFTVPYFTTIAEFFKSIFAGMQSFFFGAASSIKGLFGL